MAHSAPIPQVSAVNALAPEGILRAGINMSNSLLVAGRDGSDMPVGISPSMAQALAASLGVSLQLLPFVGPGELTDALSADLVDIGNIGADPSREAEVEFTKPYCLIDATLLVRDGSDVHTIDDVDQPGVRIATRSRAAYTLWLDRNVRRAIVVATETVEDSFSAFVSGDVEVLAGLRPHLLAVRDRLGSGRVLERGFTAVRQAVGINRSRPESGVAYLNEFVGWALASGLVAELIERFDVAGLTLPSESDD